jgi:hypothetical protein
MWMQEDSVSTRKKMRHGDYPLLKGSPSRVSGIVVISISASRLIVRVRLVVSDRV